ncbi:hypothetical protein Hanom_Chr00s000008g01616161 [Helianthus anomalus]
MKLRIPICPFNHLSLSLSHTHTHAQTHAHFIQKGGFFGGFREAKFLPKSPLSHHDHAYQKPEYFLFLFVSVKTKGKKIYKNKNVIFVETGMLLVC